MFAPVRHKCLLYIKNVIQNVYICAQKEKKQRTRLDWRGQIFTKNKVYLSELSLEVIVFPIFLNDL